MSERYPNTAAELFAAGKAHFEADEYSEAERLFREASLSQPTNAEYGAWLARVVVTDKERVDEAQSIAEAALRLDENQAVALFVLGRAADWRGDNASALGHFRRALADDPQLKAAYSNIYNILSDADQWRQAFPPFLRYHAPDLTVLTKDPARWLKLAEAGWENENYHEVYQYATRLLEADPDSWLGWVYKSLAAPHVSTPDRLRLQELGNGLRRVFAEYKGNHDDIGWLCILGAAGVADFVSNLLQGFVQQQEDYVGLHSQPVRDTRVTGGIGESLGRGLANGMAESMELRSQRQAAAAQLGQRFTRDFQEPVVSALETCWSLAQPPNCAINICNTVTYVTNAVSVSFASKQAYRQRISTLLTSIEEKYPDEVAKIPALEAAQQQEKGGCGCSPCFVATAVMGDFDDPIVLLLRQFRDTVLLRSLPGRLFVRTYYRLSPPLARWIAPSVRRRAFFYRTLIAPAATIAQRTLSKEVVITT